ncbi:hypothetical protein OF83DRAFT_1173873, partial [Amylostereum chailletii]
VWLCRCNELLCTIANIKTGFYGAQNPDVHDPDAQLARVEKELNVLEELDAKIKDDTETND